MFSGRSQAGSVESSDLDEVMRVWQHVLQPGLVDCCGDKYTVCSRFWIVVLPPILNLQDSEGDIVTLRAATMWLKRFQMWYLVPLDVLLQACASVHHWQPPDQSFSGGHRSGIHICWRLYWH